MKRETNDFVREMFSAQVQFLRGEGFKDNEIRKLLAEAAAKTSSRQVAATVAVEAGAKLSDIMRQWISDPRYLDPRGTPALLPVSGEVSFSELVRAVLPKASVDVVLTQAVKRELVVVRNSRVEYVKRTASFRKAPADRLARTAYLVGQLFGTAAFNAGQNDPRRRRLDRSVHEVVLAADARRFHALARVQGKVFVDFWDEWLAKCAAKAKKSSARKVTVGLESHSFQRDLIE